MNNSIRALTAEDEPIVWQFLMYAAHETSLESVQEQPHLARYAQNWRRVGDLGYVACQDDVAIGAAWLRLWFGEDRGFGYVDDTIPELAMAVLPFYRRLGVGSQLLLHLIDTVRNVFPGICLNVRADNPAVNLYQRVGFVKIQGSESVNRTGGTSFNMLCMFSK
jgi:GNAT superfamily N-acetyltransferase